MRHPRDLYGYQKRGIQHILDHPNAMLWQGMGLGKTVQVLTAFLDLQETGQNMAMLVVAPKRVCELVWRQEIAAWSHLRHLRATLVMGAKANREMALHRRADIYLINYDNLVWLSTVIKHRWLNRTMYPPFSMVVYDEVTKLKNSAAERSKHWYPMLPYFSRRVGLTGEPASNGYTDLHGQYLQVDEGVRLGKTKKAYQEAFLRPLPNIQHKWAATRTGQEAIRARVADITLEMRAEDYLDLPELREHIVWVDLPAAARRTYDKLEAEFFAELDSGTPIEAINEASKLVKLSQMASGAVYKVSGSPEWELVHNEKMEALEELLEEHNGKPVLLGYTFRHEAERIGARFPRNEATGDGASFLSSSLSERLTRDLMSRWDKDEIPLLCGHPASMGHGLTLSHGSCRTVAWLSLPWSLELHNQMRDRIHGGHRRKEQGLLLYILARDTVDELIYAKLKAKAETQLELMKAVNEYRKKRGM